MLLLISRTRMPGDRETRIDTRTARVHAIKDFFRKNKDKLYEHSCC